MYFPANFPWTFGTVEEKESITLAGAITTRWSTGEIIDTLGGAAKTFTLQLENTDDTLSDTYETYDTVKIQTDENVLFNGRMESIDPQESDGIVEIEGADFIGDLQGEYIIEAYGIQQTIESDVTAGSSVVLSVADTTGFEVDDEVKV
jgi:prophage tail gpP-like protein